MTDPTAHYNEEENSSESSLNEKTENSKPDTSDEFFDDEEILAGDDEVVTETATMGAFTQGDDFLVYTIEGLLNDDTEKVKPPRELRHNPPILHIESKVDGETEYVDFVLTKELVSSLEKHMKIVDKAYHGISDRKPLSQDNLKEKALDFKEWVLDHRISVILISLIIVFLIVFGFIL